MKGSIIFVTAYELDIQKDTTYGKNKQKSCASMRVAGEFISFAIGSSKYPYRTRLTILARRNGFDCMTLADDLRPQSENTTSLLGLAVMLLSN